MGRYAEAANILWQARKVVAAGWTTVTTAGAAPPPETISSVLFPNCTYTMLPGAAAATLAFTLSISSAQALTRNM